MSGAWGAIIWLVIAVVLFTIEGFTLQLLCIWFAFGALVAMLVSFVGAPLPLQLVVFFIASVAVLILGRPILKDKIIPKKTATNADAVIGKEGVVIDEIDNSLQVGRVSANGLDWTARSADGAVIIKGQKIKVKEIDGVKLIVEPVEEAKWEDITI